MTLELDRGGFRNFPHVRHSLPVGNDFGAMVSGTSRVGDTSDPSSFEGAAGTDGDNFG